MDLIRMDFGEIADLGTQVAMHGALRGIETVSADLFELVVGIAMLIYELNPGG